MTELSLYKIVELFICVFLTYIICAKFVIGDAPIILYGSVSGALFFMLIDLLLSGNNIRNMCPYGVVSNIIMCAYSFVTGFLGAKNLSALLGQTKTYLSFSIVCILICYITKREKSLEWLANFLIIVNLISAIIVLFRGYYIGGYGYVLGPDDNPNTLGFHMDIGLFCVAYKVRSNYRNIAKYFLIAIAYLFTIINCGSRKCLIAAIIICFLWITPFFLETWKKSDVNRRVILCILLLLAFCGIVYYYKKFYMVTYSYRRMHDLGTLEEDSSIHRLLYYRYALDFFLQRPLFGIGLAQFTYWNPLHQYSHSTYAEAIADWGLIGTTLYFTPILISGFRIIRMIINDIEQYLPKVVFALWIMELFLGVGQIWFYGIGHLLSWTIIFLYIDMYYQPKIVVQEECKNDKNQNSDKTVKNTGPNGSAYIKERYF